ncbi:hypothetical protein [Photobacterium leiognathi]|uniref:hypothetical protein n=1 Tax=Photobacterium leiognathi TaxID=553611 RepID=UPI002982800B|nr:hypothetical protein [Photobacterium leiognathi]
MNINELYVLSDWFNKYVVESNVIDSYNESFNDIKKLLNSNSNRIIASNSFDNIKNKMISSIDGVDYSNLTNEQIGVLKKLHLTDIILSESIMSIELLFNIENSSDYIAASINRKLQALNKAKNYFFQIKKIIPEIFDIKDSVNKDGKIFTRLTFHNKASINNIVELEQWSKKWLTISRGFSMALNKSPEEFEIIGAGKGSILVDILANIETINMVGEAINHIADFTQTCFETWAAYKTVQKLADTIDNNDMKKAASDMHDHLKNQENEHYETLAEKLIKDHDGDTNAHRELARAIKELSAFLEKGGDIECLCHEENKQCSETKEKISSALSNFKQIEVTKLLENKKVETIED